MANHSDRAFDDLRNTVNEFGRIMRSRWRLALLGVGVVCSAAFWCSQYLPRQYGAATLFERRDDVVLQNLIQSNSPYSFEHLKSSMVLDMTGSRALAHAASAAGIIPREAVPAGPGPLTAEGQRVLDAVKARHNLNVLFRMIHSSSSLDTIELRCEANNPDVARKLACALRDVYIRDTRERITDVLLSARQFFESGVGRLEAQIDEAKAALRREFAEFPGLDPTDPSAALNRLEILRAEREAAFQRKAELAAQVEAREQFLASPPAIDGAKMGPPPIAPGMGSPPLSGRTRGELEQQIEVVRRQIADARTVRRMTTEHPTVRTLQRQLDGLYAERETLLKDPAGEPPAARAAEGDPDRETYQQWHAQRLRVELELDALRKQLAIVEARFAEIATREERFAAACDKLTKQSNDLAKREDTLRQDLATLALWKGHLSQLSRILAAESEQRGTQFAILEEPKETMAALRPRVASIFGVCGGFGLAAAALLVALSELFDRSFRSAGQVTRVLGVPVLESVGVILTPRERRRRLTARVAWTPIMAVLLAMLAGTAALAYASLEYPRLHQRVVSRVDRALGAVGMPATQLAHDYRAVR